MTEFQILLAISIYFGLQGLMHFIFGKKMEKYAVENDLLNAEVAVRMSGAWLIAGSVLLHLPEYRDYGFYALCLFLLLSAVILHKFWSKHTLLDQILELLHFGKNIMLCLLLWYLHGKV